MGSSSKYSKYISLQNLTDSGTFVSCYKHPSNRNKVLLITNCPYRELMSQGKFPKSEYFPQNVRKVGITEDGKNNIYEMEKYYHIESYNQDLLSRKDRKIYNSLCETSSIDKLPKPIKNDIYTRLVIMERSGYKVILDSCDFNMMITRSNKLVLNDIFWVEHK